MRIQLAVVMVIAALLQSVGSTQSSRAQPITPRPAIDAILEAFRTHAIVALPDPQGEPDVLAFALGLLRDARLPAVLNDIVVENGNARYQALMDRYVNGEDVPFNELRQIWENTTVPQAVLAPTREVPQIYRAIRATNLSQPRERRIRILLGDPPLDWAQVTTREEYRPWLALRDSYPAALIQVEVLARQRRALVMYGHMHFQRKNIAVNYEMDAWQAQTIVSILERTTPARVFSIWLGEDLERVYEAAASWQAPALAMLAGTALGSLDFAEYRSVPSRSRVQDGTLVPVPREQWRTLPMAEQFDAVLYLGQPGKTSARASRYSPEGCQDRAFLTERLRRLSVGAPPPEVAALQKYCAERVR